MEINIFIFRRDLRIIDNTALNELLKITKKNILPIFIFNPEQIYAEKNPYFSNNAVQFMIESLESLEKNIHINYFEGNDIEVLERLNKKYIIKNIAFNIDYTPFARKRDDKIKNWCDKNKINVIACEDYSLFSMGSILNKSGTPFQIFTPFYKSCLKLSVNTPTSVLKMKAMNVVNSFNKRKYFQENPKVEIHGGRGYALKRISKNFNAYAKNRNFPSLDSTTKLSAYLKFGCISIREAFHKLKNRDLRRELIWREFYAHIMYHFPYVIGNAFKNKYNKIKWHNDQKLFDKWCHGETGFALVDAGMKQLNETGWMHNRVRMIVATFLTKDLLIDWRWGEKYFAQHLIDYDPASNNGGWQWCASTGSDSQPYFRIFNPYLQIKKFDSKFEYIKKWNPEFENKKPIIDHKKQTELALKIYQAI